MPDKRRLSSNRKKRNRDIRTKSVTRRIPTKPGVLRRGEPSEELMMKRRNALSSLPTPPTPTTNPPNQYKTNLPMITLNGMVYTNDSFSIVTRGLALGLIQNGCDVAINAWPNGSRSLPIEPKVKKAVRKTSDMKIGIRISHPNSFSALSAYKYRIGKAYFETNLFPNIPPNNWVADCNKYCDQVWVSSEFNKEVCEESGVDNVYVVHDGFDPNIFNPNGDKYPLPFDDDTFIFLTVGNSQKRKGTDLIYQAFTEEFDESEKVGLVYKSYAPWAWGAAKYAKPGRIYHFGKVIESETGPMLVDSSIPYNQMGSLYRAADCFVLPTYGEGAGVCCVESMACGVPVITTNWSAHLDYCNNKNSYLIEGERFERAFEGLDWQGEWIVPSLDQLKFYMRYVYEHPEMVKLKVKQALKDAQKFTWKNCAKEAIQKLSFVVPEVGNYIDFNVMNL